MLFFSALALLLVHVQRTSCALTEVEKEFVAVPLASGARESLKFITSKPHVAGTPGDHEVYERTKGVLWYKECFFWERLQPNPVPNFLSSFSLYKCGLAESATRVIDLLHPYSSSFTR